MANSAYSEIIAVSGGIEQLKDLYETSSGYDQVVVGQILELIDFLSIKGIHDLLYIVAKEVDEINLATKLKKIAFTWFSV